MEDDFLDARFDPKYKTLFKEKIESFDKTAVQTEVQIPIDFFGEFDNKTRQAVSNLVERVIKNSLFHNLKLRRTNPSIQFYTRLSWSAKHRSETKKSQINLPAATIDRQQVNPLIQVIIPEKAESIETVIKIARLLFAKLFGKLYFDEHIPDKPVFKAILRDRGEDTVGKTEKIHFCRLMDVYPATIERYFVQLGRELKIPGGKAKEQGKKEFFKRLEQGENDSDKIEQELLDGIFSYHREKLAENYQLFFGTVTDTLFNTLPKIGLILPHERKIYLSLQERMQPALFDGISDRLQLVKSCLEDVEGAYQYINECKDVDLADFATSDYWIQVLGDRLAYLRRKGLVKLFLIENAILAPNQRRQMLEFPLWVWRKRLYRYYPDTSPSKVIQLIQTQYKESIFQKLFEVAFRAVNCLKNLQRSGSPRMDATIDYQRLKSIISWFEFRKPIMEDVLYTCKVCSEFTWPHSKKEHGGKDIIGSFEQGWSYFISFALIHQFYLKRASRAEGNADRKAEQFFSIVEKYILQRIENQLFFQISYLLLEIYRKSGFNLEIPINLIEKKSESFDFFIVHHNEIFRSKQNKVDAIRDFAGTILPAHENIK